MQAPTRTIPGPTSPTRTENKRPSSLPPGQFCPRRPLDWPLRPGRTLGSTRSRTRPLRATNRPPRWLTVRMKRSSMGARREMKMMRRTKRRMPSGETCRTGTTRGGRAMRQAQSGEAFGGGGLSRLARFLRRSTSCTLTWFPNSDRHDADDCLCLSPQHDHSVRLALLLHIIRFSLP